MEDQAPVEVERVDVRYGRRTALSDLTFAIRPGELFGLLGPNGGGKTTALRVLATILPPTGGVARVFGQDVVTRAAAVRRCIGVVFQHPALDPRLTPLENLRHHGHLYGLRGTDLASRSRELLSRLGVGDRARDRVATLSAGLRRRVEIAKGLLHRPRLLLLDEPTAGLDPGARWDVWALVRELRSSTGVAVLVTTHLMDEAERCDRIAILDRGSLVAIGSPGDLRAGIRGDVISLASPDPRALADAIRERFGGEPAIVDGAVRIERPNGAELVPQLAAAYPGAIRSITVGRATLEDVFLRRTGHRFREDA